MDFLTTEKQRHRDYQYKYERLDRHHCSNNETYNRRPSTKPALLLFVMLVAAAFVGLLVSSTATASSDRPCDSVDRGYECQANISHFWGQYSPYFTVDSAIPSDIPPQCSVTFAQVLSRHGARDPTASKTQKYRALVQKIQSSVHDYPPRYAFLKTYNYTLGADQLTLFGEQQMVYSGEKFYSRYSQLTSHSTPFFRSSGEARVVESAQNFSQGFHSARVASHVPDTAYPYPILVIPESAGTNNTLNHGLCTALESGSDSDIASDAQKIWQDLFVPAIRSRLNADLSGANLSSSEVVYFMDLCPFNTVASPTGSISPFCSLFSPSEWRDYDYLETLGKYYGYSYGNPLGPTQGVGFTNELLARLTHRPVRDNTSTNHTLDANPKTFPLDLSLYADFSHDNDLTSILSALGLYNSSAPLSNTTYTPAQAAHGYSAAYTVPFAARIYFEKLLCADRALDGELVRVLVNDRVLPLETCGADELGRCTLHDFVATMGFARGGGEWAECFS